MRMQAAFTAVCFFSALPSEHGAWSVDECESKKCETGITCRSHFTGKESKTKPKPNNTNPNNHTQKEPVKILAKGVKPARPPKPLISSVVCPPCHPCK